MSEQKQFGELTQGRQSSFQKTHADQCPPPNNEEQLNYYNEYCRLFLTNNILNSELKELRMEKNQLITKLNRLERRGDELDQGNMGGSESEKKKRVRRPAAEISRHYKCIIKGCSKSYGSEGSLNQHLKLKHPEVFSNLSNYSLENGNMPSHLQHESI